MGKILDGLPHIVRNLDLGIYRHPFQQLTYSYQVSGHERVQEPSDRESF